MIYVVYVINGCYTLIEWQNCAFPFKPQQVIASTQVAFEKETKERLALSFTAPQDSLRDFLKVHCGLLQICFTVAHRHEITT